MRIAFIIYDGMTALDFIGFYDPLTRLKNIEWDISAISKEVHDGTGLRFTPTKISPDLGEYDILFVPGGYGSRKLIKNKKFINWLRTGKNCKLKVSVCTGSLLLGAAGFLKGKKATTHRKAFEELSKFCSVVDKRIVDEGDVITARGVTSSIDLGLYICEKLAGRKVMEEVREQIDYSFSPEELKSS